MITAPPTPVGRVILILLGLGILVTALLPWALPGRLPDPMATTWGLDGQPDGQRPVSEQAATALALSLPCTAFLVWEAFRRRPRLSRLVLTAMAAGFGFGWVGHMSLLPFLANLGHSSWTEVGGPPVWQQLLAWGLVPIVGGLLAGWASTSLSQMPPPPMPSPPVLDLPETTVVSWSRREFAPRSFFIFSGVAMVAWAALALDGNGVLYLVMFVVMAQGLLYSRLSALSIDEVSP